MLNEVKESILNAYVDKTGLSRNKLSKMMDDETWFNAKKAVELGFADKVLFDKEEEKKPGKKPAEEPEPDEGKEGESTKEGEEEEKKKPPFQQNSYAYSARNVADSFLSKVKNSAPSEPQIPIEQLRKRLDLLKR